MFRIYNDAESWRLFDAVYEQEYIGDTEKCSIWLQLATGCRFTSGTVEKSYVTLFESGHNYLEGCIERADDVAPLWVVPPMLLSCIFFMSSKPKSCWLTLSTAIRLVQVHNLDEEYECCPCFSKSEYTRWREVWRALISLDTYDVPHPIHGTFWLIISRWLSMTLGKCPQIGRNTTRDLFVKVRKSRKNRTELVAH
jgi:hypothetical protein